MFNMDDPPIPKFLHGYSGQSEYSLCGVAEDAYESGDAEEPIIFAKPGETVTCPKCRRQIKFIRKNYRRFKYVFIDKDV